MKRSKRKSLIALVLSATMLVPALGINASAKVELDSSFQLYMIPNTHLDTAWQWPYQHTADNYLRNMYGNQISALESNPDYKYTTSASAHYQWIKDYYNEDNPIEDQRYWERLKVLIENGQWDITGGQVVEPDLNIPNGEALVRQSLYAQHFFEEEFGEDNVPTAGMVPDVFGFSGQMPQILYKSGMPYFVTSKINWNESTGQGGSSDSYRDRNDGNRGRDSDILNWRAIDGETDVLAYLLYNDYNNTDTGSAVQKIFDQNWQEGKETGVKRAMAFYGGGDMGQGLAGGGNDNYEYVAKVDESTPVDVKMGTVTEYFDDVTANEDLSKLRTYEGEMYLEYHRGTYTTWARMKKYNRDNEILGESAEKAATLGFYTNSTPNNGSDKIQDAWEKVLLNQMHDVLPGSALAYQYYVTFNQHELAANLFNGVRDNALGALAYRADTDVSGKPVFVYNDLSWARDGEVTVKLEYDQAPPSSVVVYDGETPIYPTNIARDEEKNTLDVTFMATDVPAIGYKVFDVRSETAGSHTTPLKVDEENLTFENNYIKMKINPETGYISSLQYRDGDSWRETFAQNVGTEGAELHVYKDTEVRPPQNFDVWELNASEMNKEPDWIVDGAPKSISIVENTPEKVTVRVVKEWSGSEIAQDMTLYADSDRVDVHLAADWYQQKRLLKVSFPILADADVATYETSYGAIERPTDRLNAFEKARYEVPGHKWMDVTDNSGEYGVSILNDAKYGFDSLRRTLGGTTFVRSRITVARTPRAQSWAPSGPSSSHSSTWTPYTSYVVDSGTHEFNYSIYPHSGSWKDSETVNEAQELNYPMTAFEAPKGASNGLGSSESFASSDKSNVIISALKNQNDTPNDNNTVVVRVYESSGRDTGDVTITLPGNIESAKEVNMLEHDFDKDFYEDYQEKDLKIDGNKITFDIGKFEILTIEAKLTPSELEALTVPQENVALSYDQRATSSKSNRTDYWIDGDGTSENPGKSMPEIQWPADGIDYQGINFSMGPKDANNVMSANGSTLDVNAADNYGKAYIVGFATGDDMASASGDFTVTYEDGSTTSKNIKFSNWQTDLSGWDREAWIDNKPYVYDTIAHFNTHYHQTHGTTGSRGYTAIMMECHNYMFLYDIDIDDAKAVKSITLPDNANMKIAAITLANPVDGYGKVYDSSKADDWTFEAPTPDAPQNVVASYEPGTNPPYSNFVISWDKAENAVKYRIHYGTSPDFVPDKSNLLAEQGGLSYTHTSPSILGPDAMSGKGQLYYKVVAIGKASNLSEPSKASNAIAPQYIDYAQNNSRVTVSGQTNANEAGSKAVDGSLSSKWCQTGISANNPAWMRIDLTGEEGKTINVNRFDLYHAGAGGEQTSANTGAYTIEYSADSTNGTDGTWTKVVDVTNNKDSITSHVLESGVDARWIRLTVTKPEATPWTNAVRLYEFKVMGTNTSFTKPAPVSTADNAAIAMSANDQNELNLAVSYDYYNEANDTNPGTKTEGNTQFKWYKKFTDAYGDVYASIPGATSKELTQPLGDINLVTSYRCDITIYDSDGTKGETVSVEIDSPISTAKNAEIKATAIPGNQMEFTANYDYYNSINDTSPGTKVEGDTQFKWYKLINDEYVEIEGANAKTLVQTNAEAREAEAYKCEITVYDNDGTQGKTVSAEVNTYVNMLLGAKVTEETSTNDSAKKLVDGNYGTKWDVVTANENPGPCPHHAILDMGEVKSIDKIKVFHANSHPSQAYDENPLIATYDFDVSYSVDGQNWTTTEIRANTDPVTVIDLGKTVEARYVKIYVITPNAGTEENGFDTQYKAIRILEIEALQSITEDIAESGPVTLYERDQKLDSFDAAKGKTVNVKVNTNAAYQGKVNVVAATYSDSGALLNIKSVAVDVDETGAIDCTLSDFAVSQDAAKMNVFFWAADTQAPISEAILVG